jgi:signal transduction histidine kinase
VVLIDEDALRKAGRWPWSRTQFAQLVEGVVSAGAKGVALDVLFPEAGEGDPLLARALERGPSVLAAGLDEADNWLLPNQALGAATVGHVSFDLDRDGVVRHFSSTKEAGGRSLPALPVAAARMGNALLPIPIGMTLRPAFRAGPILQVSAAAVLGGAGLPDLHGRVVFLGTSAAGVGDRVVTPVSQPGSPQPGILVEAVATEAILSGDLLRVAPPLVNALLVFALGFLGAVLLDARGRGLARLAPCLILLPVPAAGVALHLFDLELAPMAILGSLLLVGSLFAGLRFRRAGLAMGTASSRIGELEGLQASLAERQKDEAEARRVVAHELKTPLTSVRGLAQLLAQFELSAEERNRVARMVVTETSRLAEMVDALLDLERLRLRDRGRDARLMDLSAICERRVDILRAGGQLGVLADIEAGLRIQGDPALLERVIDNLVGNAIKFSPAGSPVHLRLRSDGLRALLEIEDHGPGVPVADRERIFGRFARGTTQGPVPGLGLGLALVAEVVTWHQGTVKANGGPDGGSIFRVSLPLAPLGKEG